VEIASWQALDEKLHLPSNMHIGLNPLRHQLFQMEKQKTQLGTAKNLGSWSGSDTFIKGSNILFTLQEDSDS